MNKIVIIGISGTGKTSLAHKLSKITKLPIIHYDELVWGKNWLEINEKIVEQGLKEAINQDKWIIEGYIHPAAKERLEKADIVIYLDYSGLQSMIGGLQRWWKHRGKTRPEMADGCIEKFDWKYLRVMLERKERPEIEEAIKNFENKVIRLNTRKDVQKFLENQFGKELKLL